MTPRAPQSNHKLTMAAPKAAGQALSEDLPEVASDFILTDLPINLISHFLSTFYRGLSSERLSGLSKVTEHTGQGCLNLLLAGTKKFWPAGKRQI